MKLKLPRKDGGRRWPLLAAYGITAGIVLACYGLRLGSLVPASGAEQAMLEELSSLGNIGHDLLLAPYKLLAWLFLQLPGNDLTNLRAASAVLALICAVLLFTLARRWHGPRIGATTAVLFGLSGWLLSTGRHGAGFIMLTLSVLGLLSTTVLINKAEDKRHADKAVLAFAAAVAVALTTPGGIWFTLATVVVVGKQLLGHVRLASGIARAGAGAILAVGLAVLAAVCISGSGHLYQVLAIPQDLPSIIVIVKQLVLNVSGFVLRGPDMPSLWLAHTPLLDVATTTLLVLGAILYARHLNNSRTRLLLAFAVVGALLTTLNGPIALSYTIPIVYLVVASGLAYFHHQWHKVFPRNPVAEAVSIIILAVLVICIVGFHTQRYFIAWRYSPATAEAYRQAASNSGRQDVPYLIQ